MKFKQYDPSNSSGVYDSRKEQRRAERANEFRRGLRLFWSGFTKIAIAAIVVAGVILAGHGIHIAYNHSIDAREKEVAEWKSWCASKGGEVIDRDRQPNSNVFEYPSGDWFCMKDGQKIGQTDKVGS